MKTFALTYQTDMEFLEVLTEGLERVLLVRGGGSEVITIYSWLVLSEVHMTSEWKEGDRGKSGEVIIHHHVLQTFRAFSFIFNTFLSQSVFHSTCLCEKVGSLLGCSQTETALYCHSSRPRRDKNVRRDSGFEEFLCTECIWQTDATAVSWSWGVFYLFSFLFEVQFWEGNIWTLRNSQK